MYFCFGYQGIGEKHKKQKASSAKSVGKSVLFGANKE